MGVKTLLFYFSGTGNSLKVARDLSVELGETELVSIPQAFIQWGRRFKGNSR